MTLDVHPDSLRTLGRLWEQAGDVMPVQAQMLEGVGHGGEDFGRINRFLSLAVSVFVWRASDLAQECADALQQGGRALHAAARDLEEVDADVARLMGGKTEEPQESVWV